MGNVNHLRLVFTGRRKAPSLAGEIWQMGISMMPNLGTPITVTGPPEKEFDAAPAGITLAGAGYTAASNFLLEGGVNDIDPADYLVDGPRVAMQDYLNTPNSFPLDVYCEKVELYPIGDDGHVLADVNGIFKANVTWTSTTACDGTTTTTTFAPFTSWAVSLGTPSNTPRGRGRFYPPPIPTAYTSTVTGLMDSTQRGTYAASAEQFLTTCSLTDNVNNVYVRPIVIGAPYATAYPVVRVSVDNIPDTQRRRKNRLVSERTSVPMTF